MNKNNFSFVHAADLHLDSPFSGMARIHPRIARQLKEASLEAFNNLIDLVLNSGASFLLLAGDIYDSAERSVRAQLRMMDGFKRLQKVGISVFIVHGNHDPLSSWNVIDRWPPNVHVFGGNEVETVEIFRDGQHLGWISGISYAQAEVKENLVLRFPEPNNEGLKIALLHASLNTGAEVEAYSPCSQEDLLRLDYDYWALGHLHKLQIIRMGKKWIVYPGSLQGRHLKPSEQSAKGAVLVKVVKGEIEDVSFEALDKVRFLEFSVDISTAETHEVLVKLLKETTAELQKAHIGRCLVIRGFLEGKGGLAKALRKPSVAQSLLEYLRDEYLDSEPFVWWDQLINLSKSEIDLSLFSSREDFLGSVVNYSEALLTEREKLESFIEELLEPLYSHSVVKSRGLESVENDISNERLVLEALSVALEEAEGECG